MRKDGEILIFPMLSGLLCVLVTASFFGPLVLAESATESVAGSRSETAADLTLFLLLFAFYFVTYFVIYFFNAAVIGCAVKRMRGGDPTVKDGFRIAFSRLPQLLGWAAVSATVGMILRVLERHRVVGGIVAGLLGMAWTVTTYLAVPILVVQGKGPIAAAKESASLLRSTWGSQVLGTASFGLIGFLGFLLLAAIGLAVLVLLGPSTIWAVGAFVVIGAVLVFVVTSALGTIYQAALYLYATDGSTPDEFEGDMLSGAMRSQAA